MHSHHENADNNTEQKIAAKKNFFASILTSSEEELTWNVDELGKINAKDLTDLNTYLQKNSGIKILDLTGNRLGENKELMVSLVKLLEDNSQIISLDLYLNFIDTQSLDIILQSEKLRPRLKNMRINFLSNMIDDEGFKKAVDYFSRDSLDSMLRGNIMKDKAFIKQYREEIKKPETQSTNTIDISKKNSPPQTSQSGMFPPPSKSQTNHPAPTSGSTHLKTDINKSEEEHKEYTPPKRDLS
jgi:hypothetical protein